MKTCSKCNLRYPEEAVACFVDGAELVRIRDPRIDTILSGRYLVQDVLAEGGMATVYVARHRLTGRAVAVKIIGASLARNRVNRERFKREAKATQKLAHPNIIEVLDQGATDDGMPYIVMELLHGETLADRIARGPIPLGRTIPIAIEIARALSRAHDFEVVHRDLKPDNIYLHEAAGVELVKLLDFGIARSMHDTRLTNAGEVFGTPQYMAPERITSIDAGPSADLYSFGVIVFEMLSGRLPFDAPDIPSILVKHMSAQAPLLRSMVPSIPENIESLVASLISKRPDDRPVDAHRVHSDLVHICNELGIDAPPSPEDEDRWAQDRVGAAPAPAPEDAWDPRIGIIQRMLEMGYGSAIPSHCEDLLRRIESTVTQLRWVRRQTLEQQRRLASLEMKEREDRQRFGFAMDALGVDASKARDEARSARCMVQRTAGINVSHLERVAEMHREAMQWEGRVGLGNPCKQLADCYRALAAEMDAWLEDQHDETTRTEYASYCDGVVLDLDYQISELRNGLSRLEQSIDDERSAMESKCLELAKETDEIEAMLASMTHQLTAPLRAAPELRGLVAELDASYS